MPASKPAATRQRRNRTTTAARLVQAAPAEPAALPPRYSATRCVAIVDAADGCGLSASTHDLAGFRRAKVEPHEFEPAEQPWHPNTVHWWATIWASPMAGEWVDADAPALLELAALTDEFWRTLDPKIAAEVRMRQREFGLTPMARRSLQWEVQRVEREAVRTPARTPTRREDPRRMLRALS